MPKQPKRVGRLIPGGARVVPHGARHFEPPRGGVGAERMTTDMISTGDLKKGISIEFEGQLFQIVDWQHIKMGRGGAIVRMKLRNLRTGANIERTVDAGEKFPRAFLDH